MDVFQCPVCELRFRLASEMEQHLRFDHPDFQADAKTAEGQVRSASHRHRHAPGYKPSPEKNAD